MPTMFIQNCTKQNQIFIYNRPEKGAVKIEIPMGGQARVPGELTTGMIQDIINQHATYGMVCADELDRTKTFVGLTYTLDKPAPAKKIHYAMEHNFTVLTKFGQEMRDMAALGAQGVLDKQIGQNTTVALEIEEEASRDNSTPSINEKITALPARSREGAAPRSRETTGRRARG